VDNANQNRWQKIGLAGVLFLTLALLGCPGGAPRPRLPANNPLPTVASISPSTVTAGGAAFTLTVTGTGFVAGSVVRLDGADRATTFVSGTQLQAAITAADIAAAGAAQITVFSPAPGGGTSSALTLAITLDSPLPALSSLSPASVTAGGLGFTLSVTGADFVAASVVQVNGAARTTTFLSSTELQAAITAADIAAAGTAQITVFTPAPGGGTSNILNFTIAPSAPGTTARVSLAANGAQGNAPSGSPAIDASGRFIAFASLADTLVTGDSNGVVDVFLRDTCVGAAPGCTPSTSRVSVGSSGTQGDNQSSSPAIGADGRFIAFESIAGNLVTGDTNGTADIFLRDTCFGAPAGCSPSTVRLSVSSAGAEGNGQSLRPAISADGRFIAFESTSDNLVSGDANGVSDIFLRDTCSGAGAGCSPSTARLSVSSAGAQGAADSFQPTISGTGRFVAFSSFANDLVANDTNGNFDVFLRDTCFSAAAGCSPSTVRLSVASNGTEGNAESSVPSISGTGRFVAFQSASSTLIATDTNGAFDIFLRDTCFGAAAGCSPSTIRVAVSTAGAEGNAQSLRPAIRATGRLIAFQSAADNLVTGDTNGVVDIFVRDTCFGAPAGCAVSTVRVSVAANGTESNGDSEGAAISAAAPFVAFQSNASTLAASDTNGVADVFVAATGF